MILDMIRRPYRSKMRLWADKPDLVSGRWFFADAGARTFPGFHFMGARVWARDRAPFYVPLGPTQPGEIGFGGGPWTNGVNTAGYLGTNFCGRAAAFLTGGVTGTDPPIVTDAFGSNPCCRRALPGAGGVVLGGKSAVTVPPLTWPLEICSLLGMCYQDLDVSSYGSPPVDGLPLPGVASPVVRLVSADGPLTINSIVPDSTLQYLRIVNASGESVTLVDFAPATAPAVAFTLGGDNLTVPPDGVVDLWCYPGSGGMPEALWYVLGSRGGGLDTGYCTPFPRWGYGQVDDFHPGNGDVLLVENDNPTLLTGINSLRVATSGSRLSLVNGLTTGPFGLAPLTLAHYHSASPVGSRLWCPGAADVVLAGDQMAILQYAAINESDSAWYVMPQVPSAGAVSAALAALGGISGSY
jgi:hypothetical protein